MGAWDVVINKVRGSVEKRIGAWKSGEPLLHVGKPLSVPGSVAGKEVQVPITKALVGLGGRKGDAKTDARVIPSGPIPC